MGPRRLQNTRPRDLILRLFAKGDGPATFEIFYQAVHSGTGGHYSPAHQTAWAPSTQVPEDWETVQFATTVVVALQREEIIGFTSLTSLTNMVAQRGVDDIVEHLSIASKNQPPFARQFRKVTKDRACIFNNRGTAWDHHSRSSSDLAQP